MDSVSLGCFFQGRPYIMGLALYQVNNRHLNTQKYTRQFLKEDYLTYLTMFSFRICCINT